MASLSCVMAVDPTLTCALSMGFANGFDMGAAGVVAGVGSRDTVTVVEGGASTRMSCSGKSLISGKSPR